MGVGVEAERIELRLAGLSISNLYRECFRFWRPMNSILDSGRVGSFGNVQNGNFTMDRTRQISALSAEAIAQAAQAHGQQDDITVLTVVYAGAELTHAWLAWLEPRQRCSFLVFSKRSQHRRLVATKLADCQTNCGKF